MVKYLKRVCLLFFFRDLEEKKKKSVSVKKKYNPGPQAWAESKGNIFVWGSS